MDESQLIKGILEGCILGIISRGETYGYEILMVLENYSFSGIYEGTLYPILSRLEKKGFILCRLAKSSLGPKRKYYSITEIGIEEYKLFTESFQKISDRTFKILNDNILDEKKDN